MKVLFKLILRKLGVGLVIAALPLLAVSAQESFQIKWSMDYTQDGASTHPNFTPVSAALLGGTNAYTLPTVYSPGGAIVTGYITRPWPISFSAARSMEFAFAANSFKYSITSFSFRLRRSPTGPDQIKVRSSAEHFSKDLDAFLISNSDKFNTYIVPVAYSFLSNNTFAFRIYAYNSAGIHGVLWFDEIIVNGLVHPIILPVELTHFTGAQIENYVDLHWETAWEKNSSEFIVEKSADLVHFDEIGSIPAAGETAGRKAYYFKDEFPITGAGYYRLRLVDKDGSFTVSKTISVLFEKTGTAFRISPNPASPEKIIITGEVTNPEQLLLTTSAGVQIPFIHFKKANKSLILQPLTPLSPGLYLLNYQKNIGKEHVKILVR
jgi:hypothetical protein